MLKKDTSLRDLRNITQQMADIFSNAQKEEIDAKYESFLNEQLNILDKALSDSETPDEYKVAIVGTFKVGKSSFVNALCDVKGLASVNVNPETAAITTFQYQQKAHAKIYMTAKEEWEEMAEPYKDNPSYSDDSRYGAIYRVEQQGKLKKEYSISLEKLEQKYIASPGKIEIVECKNWEDQKSRSAFNKEIKQYMSRRNPVHYLVDRLAIYVPVPFLQNDIELIDTPGLNDTDRYRVRLTEKLVEDVDVILYLTQSGAAYSQSDKDFITTQLRKGKIKHLLVIVTKCDVTFNSAIQDAEDDGEYLPTFSEHIEIEQKRIHEQIKSTLDELLDDKELSDERGYFYIDLLDDVNISFISSNYYRDSKKEESGIEELRDKLSIMLAESERISTAKRILSEALNRVCDRTSNNFRTRLDAVTKEFNVERVRKQLEEIKLSINNQLGSFKKIVQERTELLVNQNIADWEFADLYIQNMMLQAENSIDIFENEDIAKHWKTRRYRNWGGLDEVQEKIANRIFPKMKIILGRYSKRFEEVLDTIRKHLNRLQDSVVEIEKNSSLDNIFQPINLTQVFDNKFKLYLNDLQNFVVSQEQGIIGCLDDFISEEIEDEIYNSRDEVAEIWGTGTVVRQDRRIRRFYSDLKKAVKKELEKFLTAEIKKFSQILKKKSELVYPELKSDLNMVLEDHLKAIETNLIELNKHQKESLVQYLTEFLEDIDGIREKQLSLEKQDVKKQ